MGKTPRQHEGTASGAEENPWGRVLEQMLRCGPALDGEESRSRASKKPSGSATGPAGGTAGERPSDTGPGRRGGLDEIIGDMFDSGAKMQKDYQRNLESIFDEFLGGMRKG